MQRLETCCKKVCLSNMLFRISIEWVSNKHFGIFEKDLHDMRRTLRAKPSNRVYKVHFRRNKWVKLFSFYFDGFMSPFQLQFTHDSNLLPNTSTFHYGWFCVLTQSHINLIEQRKSSRTFFFSWRISFTYPKTIKDAEKGK